MFDPDIFTQNIPASLKSLYNAGDPKNLNELLENALALEKDWTKDGFSDGFYIYYQLKDLIGRSMKEDNTDMTSFLLSFQNRHFDSAFHDALDENETDLLFGLKELPQIYFSPGSVIEFGNYQWSDLNGAPASPIKWESLVMKKDRALIVSKYGIDTMAYHDSLSDITWETCSLRKWLNTDFLETAFSPDERERIIETVISNPGASSFVKGGNDTTDRIFLLNVNEIEDLAVNSDRLRKKASPYAKKAGASVNEKGCCKWLLRSPGNMWMSSAFVDDDGSIDRRGIYIQDKGYCICPALWIKIPDRN